MSGLSYAARVLWLLGFPDQALQRSDAALSLARDVGIPGNLAFRPPRLCGDVTYPPRGTISSRVH